MYQLVRVEREINRSLNGSQLQELSVEYLRLYGFGHFHHAWYFNWYALEIQYLHLKTETRLLTDAFVCKHQVVVWNSVLSEQFDEPAVICTGKDGLRWVIFFLLKMWVSYFPITIYLEHLSTSTQKSNRIIVRTMAQIIAHVYRLSAVHCQVTRYSQTVPGYLTWYSRCQPMKSLLTKKLANQSVSFNWC